MHFRERRFTPQEIEIRDGDKGPEIRGHAIVYDTLSVELWGFREEVAPGAFDDSLTSPNVRALWSHDSGAVLGRTGSGTLELSSDDVGLAFVIYPPDSTVGRDAVTSIRRGDVDQMSFGFSIFPGGETWRESDDGELIRRVTSGTLYEVSPVAFPAYPATSATLRDMRIGDAVRQYDDAYGVIPKAPPALASAATITVSGSTGHFNTVSAELTLDTPTDARASDESDHTGDGEPRARLSNRQRRLNLVLLEDQRE